MNNNEFYQNKRILITGANGFIGRYLTEALISLEADISVIDRCFIGYNYESKKYEGDLKNQDFVKKCIKETDPEIIFHLAAFKERSSEIEDFLQAININLLGSFNLFSSAKELKYLSSIVVVGTAEEYGSNKCPFVEDIRESPVSAYSFTKLCVTHLCEVFNRIYNLPFIVLRPSVAYGPRQNSDMFLPALISSLLNDKPFPMTHGKQTRDFIYVTDLVNALILAAKSKISKSEIINVGSGQSIAIIDLAHKIEKILGKSNLVQVGAKKYRSCEVMEYCVDIEKAKKHIDWEPVISLEEGLMKTVEHYQRNCL